MSRQSPKNNSMRSRGRCSFHPDSPASFLNHLNNDIVDVRQTGTPGRMVLHYLSIGTSAAGLTGCAYTRAMPAIFTQSRSCESGTGMRCCVISITRASGMGMGCQGNTGPQMPLPLRSSGT